MKKEDKELLLRDLCARLPYGVKVYGLYSPEGSFYSKWHNGELIAIDITINTNNPSFEVKFEKPVPYRDYCSIEEIKPYLRPMSSMTKKEQGEFVKFHCVNLCPIVITDLLSIENEAKMIDWLNAHQFDYRKTSDGKTMIEAGLAREASEDMYNT